jgi:hypothetical protein
MYVTSAGDRSGRKYIYGVATYATPNVKALFNLQN